MSRKKIYVALSLFLFLPFIALNPAYNQDKPFIVVINPCSGNYDQYMKNWLMPYNRHMIREWGVSRGLELINDRGPVVDDLAAYVGPFGSTISINGLSREKRYRIWIDFVRFKSKERRLDSELHVIASAPGMEPRLIETIRSSDITGSYYFVDIPVSISVRGGIEIRFIEYSTEPGNWGIWDIIVSSVGELPHRIDIPGDESINLEINDRIVQ